MELLLKILFYFYGFTFCVGPAVLGFLSGRFFHLFFRYLFVIWVAVSGYLLCRYSGHGFFTIFFPGNVAYVLFFFVGVFLRQKKTKEKFSLHQILDGLLVLLLTIVCMCLYQKPVM